MAQLAGSYDVLDEPVDETHPIACLDEYDRLPLRLRLKTLLSRKGLSVATHGNLGIPGNEGGSMSQVDTAIKNEENRCDGQDVFSLPLSCLASEGSNSELSREQEMYVDTVAAGPCLQDASSNQDVGKASSFVTERVEGEVDAHTIGADEVIANFSNSPQHSKSPSIHAVVKVEYGDNTPKSSSGDGIVGSSVPDMLAVKNEHVILNVFADELDCISLRERQRMLFARKQLGIMKPVFQGNPEQVSNQPMKCHAGAKSGDGHFVNGSSPVAGHPSPSIPDGSACDPCTISRSGPLDGTLSGSSRVTHQQSPLGDFVQATESIKSRNCKGNKASLLSSEKISTKVSPSDVQGFVSCGSAVLAFAKVKDEPSDCNDLCSPSNIESTRTTGCMGFYESDQKCSSDNDTNVINVYGSQDSTPSVPYNTLGSALSPPVRVKDELSDDNYSKGLDKNAARCSLTDFPSLKNELQTPDESLEDLLDHMPLQDRIKLMMSGNISDMNTFKNLGCSTKNVQPGLENGPASEPVKPISCKRPRKRKRTATNSVETALEEDAPGLLRALADKGVSMDEIKLYDDMENDDILDGPLTEDSFSELQAVMSKIFSQRQSLLKFAPIRCAKGAKASYCLACLVSLVEQSRYLQFRKWPVEWGWCRDLRSFIFVFERHHRIVLERPEYGFATYFFEIADSLPVDWQIKRLVTTMKLTNCSRITLIENKALSIGEDLSEGEANVMMEYGWTPNSGLASMLNYCDRVVHDKKKEDGTEWRSKIRKLLMDGYNGGTLVSTIIPKKVIEYNAEQSAQIKLEL